MYEEREKQGYVSEFLSLKCAGDVLNVVNPLGNKAAKEITESMAVIKVLRGIVLPHPMEYILLDLCAGNALTSVLAVHLLPIASAEAVDKRKRDRKWGAVKRFKYTASTLEDYPLYTEHILSAPAIVCAVHPCKTALGAVTYFQKSPRASHLVLMPCCRGGIDVLRCRFTSVEREKLDKYERWCLYLARLCAEFSNVTMRRDLNCTSPCNILIVAEKGAWNE